MKKLTSIIITTIIVLNLFCILCGISVSADGTSGDYNYELLNDNTVGITEYKGSMSEVIIPSEINGHTVTSIRNKAFKFCYNLTSITIPDSVTSIGEQAFFGCTSLTNVTNWKQCYKYRCESVL